MARDEARYQSKHNPHKQRHLRPPESGPYRVRYIGWCKLDATKSPYFVLPDNRLLTDRRWYEKAGLPAGCVKLPISALNQVQKGDRLMKKNTTAKKSPKGQAKGQQKQVRRMAEKQRLTVGLDLGDRTSRYCILDEAGDVVSESQQPTTKTGLNSLFAKMASSRIALEVGTHSPWVSRHLAGMG